MEIAIASCWTRLRRRIWPIVGPRTGDQLNTVPVRRAHKAPTMKSAAGRCLHLDAVLG
jgi:hypothetical protein